MTPEEQRLIEEGQRAAAQLGLTPRRQRLLAALANAPAEALPQPPAWLPYAEGARDIGREVALGLSGYTLASEAGRNLAEAQQAGDPIRGAAAIGEAGLAALPVTRLGRAMFATVPRAMGTGLGTGLTIETASGRGPLGTAEAADNPVIALQEQLRDAGFYRGPIDGKMGPATQAAKAAFDAAQAQTRQQELEAARVKAERARAESEAASAAAKAAETKRLGEESTRKATEREAGSKRLREVEANRSPVVTALRDYGPLLGYAGGVLAGHGLQRAMMGAAARAAERTAQRADRIMTRPVANPDIPGRVGRVNQFWAEGAPSRAEPFAFAAGQRPHPYVVNPSVMAAGELYAQPLGRRIATAATVPAMGGAEWVASDAMFAHPSRRALAEAERALAADPSEANIQRVETLRNRVALADLMVNIGRGWAGGAVGSQLLHGAGTAARPAMVSLAERERGRLTAILSRPPKPAAAPRKKRAAQQRTGE